MACKDQDCPNSKDGHGHCPHWWDGEDCCWCVAKGRTTEDDILNHLTKEQMIEQGMIDEKPYHKEWADLLDKANQLRAKSKDDDD